VKNRVAVCMPVYNAEAVISKSVESILTQTFEDFKFIITDDCSIDSTAKVIESVRDPRIVFLRNQENLGTITTRNNMLGYCLENDFEYMAIMDADDIAYPKRLEKQIRILDQDQAIAVCGSSMEIERTGGIWLAQRDPDQIKVECLFGNPIPTSSATIRLRFMRQFDLKWDKSFWPCADYHLWYFMLYIEKLRARNTGDVDMLYSYSPQGVSHGRGLLEQELKDAKVKQLIFECFGFSANDEDAFSFTKVVLYRSHDPSHAAGFLKVARKILEKNSDKIVDDRGLKRGISHRASTYLTRTRNIPSATRNQIQKTLVFKYCHIVTLLEAFLIKTKINFLDYYFPNLSRELVKMYFRLRPRIIKF